MNNFNISRVASLLRYDWMLHKHTLKLTAAVISIIYVGIAILYFTLKRGLDIQEVSVNTHMPTIIATFCVSFFSYANFAVMLVVTTLLTAKFCAPRTATAYLTLPGTSLEKFAVVLIDYFVAFVACKALYLVMFYATMFVCYLNMPELDWSQNGFALLLPLEQSNEIFNALSNAKGIDFREMIENAETYAENSPSYSDPSNPAILIPHFAMVMKASIYMAPFASMMLLFYYMVLCMNFKTNVQIKGIACVVLTYIAFYIVCLVFFCFGIGAYADEFKNSPEMVFGIIDKLLVALIWFIYSTPAICAGLLYLFYRQISHKQAK